MTNALLRLLQLSDSGFPTGGYAYSHGLEFLFREGHVTDATGVRQVMEAHLDETLASIDLPLLAHAYRATRIGEAVDVDWYAHALKPVPVFRDASLRTGRRFLDASLATFANLSVTASYRDEVTQNRAPGHHAVAFGLVAAESEIDSLTALGSFALTSMQGYVAAAVRLSIIGQTTAQRILASFSEDIEVAIQRALTLSLSDLGGFAPMIDFAGLEHRYLSGRLFAS